MRLCSQARHLCFTVGAGLLLMICGTCNPFTVGEDFGLIAAFLWTLVYVMTSEFTCAIVMKFLPPQFSWIWGKCLHSNGPFYSYRLKPGWSWPCFATTLPALLLFRSYEPRIWPRSPVLRSSSGQSARTVFGRSQVRIPSGTQIFSLSHARDMLIISFSHKSCCPYANHYFQSSIISITKRGRFVSKQGQTKSTTVKWSILSIQWFFRLIEYRSHREKCTALLLLISHVVMQISIPHVRYWWLRGFMKKTANFAQLYCLPIPGRYEH